MSPFICRQSTAVKIVNQPRYHLQTSPFCLFTFTTVEVTNKNEMILSKRKSYRNYKKMFSILHYRVVDQNEFF